MAPANSKFTCSSCGGDLFRSVTRYTGLGNPLGRGHGTAPGDDRHNPLTIECRECTNLYAYDTGKQMWEALGKKPKQLGNTDKAEKATDE